MPDILRKQGLICRRVSMGYSSLSMTELLYCTVSYNTMLHYTSFLHSPEQALHPKVSLCLGKTERLTVPLRKCI